MSVRTLFVAVVVLDAVPSFFLWLLSPTDSVRVWYENPLSYIAVHALGMAAVLPSFLMLQRVFAPNLWKRWSEGQPGRIRLTLSRTLLLGVLLVSADIAATLLVAAIQLVRTHELSLDYTETITGYILNRDIVYLVLMTLILGFFLALQMVRTRRGNVSSGE